MEVVLLNAVSKRYALAAFEAAVETGETADLLASAQKLSTLFKDLPRLVKFLSDERFSLSKRAGAAVEVCDFMNLSRSAVGLVKVAVMRGRAKLLPDIAEDLVQRISSAMGLAKATITASDASIGVKVVAKIESALGNALGSKVVCELKEDKSLMGGFFLECGGKTFDASVKGRLARLREQLTEK